MNPNFVSDPKWVPESEPPYQPLLRRFQLQEDQRRQPNKVELHRLASERAEWRSRNSSNYPRPSPMLPGRLTTELEQWAESFIPDEQLRIRYTRCLIEVLVAEERAGSHFQAQAAASDFDALIDACLEFGWLPWISIGAAIHDWTSGTGTIVDKNQLREFQKRLEERMLPPKDGGRRPTWDKVQLWSVYFEFLVACYEFIQETASDEPIQFEVSESLLEEPIPVGVREVVSVDWRGLKCILEDSDHDLADRIVSTRESAPKNLARQLLAWHTGLTWETVCRYLKGDVPWTVEKSEDGKVVVRPW